MERQAKILKFCKKNGKGLEIGPSFNPVASKNRGYDVDILDCANADELKKKYASLGMDISLIEPVDFIWAGEPIDELIGEAAKYDWIIASHVIEHVPDLISFLRSCSKLLKADGVLSLAVPDKRYCFDYFRWPSSTGDIWQAWIEKRKKHTAGAIFDQNSYGCKKGEKHAWDKMHRGELSFIHDFSLIAKTFDSYREIDEYVDIHAWRFTPSSFRLIILELKQLGLIDFSEVGFYDTEGCEFFISLGHTMGNEVDNGERLAFCERAAREIAEVAPQSFGEKGFSENPSSSSYSARPSERFTSIQKAIKYFRKHGVKKTVSRLFLELKYSTGIAKLSANVLTGRNAFEGQLITGTGGACDNVYYVENNKRRWVISPEIFRISGFQAEYIQRIPDTDVNAFQEGAPIATESVRYGWNDKEKRYMVTAAVNDNTPAWINLRNELSARYIRGNGIEIGAHYLPVKVNADVKVRYIDILPAEENQKRFPEHAAIPVDIIDDGEVLSSVENGSLDFIIANHFLEHCENPLGTIRNHLLKLRPEGILYYAVPNKDFTFDRDRSLTTFDHLTRDDHEGPDVSRLEHYRDWARFVDKIENLNDVESKARQMMSQDLRIHFHVWDLKSFEEFLVNAKDYLGKQFITDCIHTNGIEVIAILRANTELGGLATGEALQGICH